MVSIYNHFVVIYTNQTLRGYRLGRLGISDAKTQPISLGLRYLSGLRPLKYNNSLRI
jgi:hypothetical protein